MTKKNADLEIDPTADVPADNEVETTESAASDTLKPHGVDSKIDMMTNTVSHMAKMGHEELTNWFRKAIETSKGYAATGKDTSASNKASIKAKPSGTGANPMGAFPYVPVAKEDLAVVFDALEIKENDLQDKVLTIFEAALNGRVIMEKVKIEEAYEAKLVEEIEIIRTDLTEKVDQYLDYAAQEFVTENEIAIENALKLELFEDFMSGLHQLFVEHYVDVPDDKLDVMTQMSEQVVELKAALDEKVEENLAQQEMIDEMVAQGAFDEIAEGLSITDTEKFKSLVETVEFDGNVDALKNKLNIIKEANFKAAPKKAVKTGIIQEGTEVVITGDINEDGSVEVKKADPRVANYVAAISRVAKSMG